MAHQILDVELEKDLEFAAFETYKLYRGQQVGDSATLRSAFKSVGVFKVGACPHHLHDPSPFSLGLAQVFSARVQHHRLFVVQGLLSCVLRAQTPLPLREPCVW